MSIPSLYPAVVSAGVFEVWSLLQEADSRNELITFVREFADGTSHRNHPSNIQITSWHGIKWLKGQLQEHFSLQTWTRVLSRGSSCWAEVTLLWDQCLCFLGQYSWTYSVPDLHRRSAWCDPPFRTYRLCWWHCKIQIHQELTSWYKIKHDNSCC